jgi:diacylglycerol O-acyltransferase-1
MAQPPGHGQGKSDLVVDSDEDDIAPPDPPRHNHMLFHVTRPSLLSSEASKSTYRGLVNIGLIAVVLINLRQMLDASHTLQQWCSQYCFTSFKSLLFTPWHWPMTMLLVGLNVFIVGTFLAEKLAVLGIDIPPPGQSMGADVIRNCRSVYESAVMRIHTVLMALQLVTPCAVVLLTDPHPACAAPVVILYLLWFMKGISYIVLNHQQRCSYISTHVRYILSHEEKRVASGDFLDEYGDEVSELHRRKAEMLKSGFFTRYPANVTFRDIYYFAFSPTLCYDIAFPRTRRIRWRWLLRRSFELFLSMSIVVLVINRQMLPNAFNLPTQVSSWAEVMPFAEFWSRVLMYNLLVWLLGFYAFFHLFLNIVAEALNFGDRLFYLDFWNATSIDHFWRTWSIPGYRWMLRHVYGPLLKSGYSRTQASGIVFLMSALIHEYTLGIVFQQFRFLAFALVAVQVPLAIMTQRFVKGTQLGNIIFWLNMAFGPHCFCTLIYTLTYLRHQYPTCPARSGGSNPNCGFSGASIT